MTEFTTIPTRPLAEFARTLQKGQDTEHDTVSVMQLLHILRCKFEQEEEAISASLLHYRDSTLHLQQQRSKVHFTLPGEKEEADLEECKPRRVYPVTPQRPDPGTLAKLMEVSYTEWSETSFEDTTGDSKLAQWLASFASKDLNLPVPSSSSQEISPAHTTKKISVEHASDMNDTLDSSSSRSFLPLAFASPNRSPYLQRHHPNASLHAGSPRRRALSDPPTPSKQVDRHMHTRSRSTSHSTLSPQKKHLNEETERRHVAASPFLKTSTFSPFSFKFRQILDEADSSQSLASPPLTPSTSNPNQSPVTSIRSPPFRTPLSHAVRFVDLENELSLHQSNANGLADISGVHTFNLSMQHSTKSPFLIRTWKRMLGELTGRFPLSLGERGSAVDEDDDQSARQAYFREFSRLEAQDDESSDSEELPSKSGDSLPAVDATSSTPGLPSFQTHADVLLDREYAAYLRGSISEKRKEIRCLQELITHREKTIDRMEFALKRRALEVLGSHEV